VIICLCHRISERDIERAVREGVRDFEALQEETCLARNCGCCHDAARQVYEAACTRRLHPVALAPARRLAPA